MFSSGLFTNYVHNSSMLTIVNSVLLVWKPIQKFSTFIYGTT